VNSDKCIIVYLDTQDYANLYKDDVSNEYLKVKQQLIDFKESGRVKFPLSFLTLFEFIQDYPSEFELDRQKRSEFMSKICSTNTLPYFMDLALKGAKIDEKTWLPSGSIENFSVSKMLSIMRYKIKEHNAIPRQLKRNLQNPLVLKNYLKDYLTRQVNSNDLTTNWNAELPELSFEFFVDYLLGKITEVEADAQLRESVFEPAKFFEIWYKRFSNKNALLQFYGQPIEKLYQVCAMYYEKMPQVREKYAEAKKNLQKSIKEIEKLRELHPDGYFDDHRRMPELPRAPSWEETYQSSDLANKMSLFNDQTRCVFERYFADVTSIRFKPKKSDVVDAFHTVYIDHVDLWRTDKAWADFLLRADVFPKHKIVASLMELPSKIHNLLTET
jgi:hypothetical protein